MQDELELLVEEQMTDTTSTPDRKYEDDVFKKWFKTGSKQGFIAIRAAFPIGKFVIDIGETGEGSLKGNTQCYVNAIDLATYVQAVYDGTATRIYRKNGKAGVPTDEGLVYYGGSASDKNYNGSPVSRVLKVHHWVTGSGDNASYDDNAFVWKCGHFAGKVTQTGAILPNMTSPLSVNSIKVTRQEMALINTRMRLALSAFAAKTPDFFRALNGNDR